jgi:hypothetical protein
MPQPTQLHLKLCIALLFIDVALLWWEGHALEGISRFLFTGARSAMNGVRAPRGQANLGHHGASHHHPLVRAGPLGLPCPSTVVSARWAVPPRCRRGEATAVRPGSRC